MVENELMMTILPVYHVPNNRMLRDGPVDFAAWSRDINGVGEPQH